MLKRLVDYSYKGGGIYVCMDCGRYLYAIDPHDCYHCGTSGGKRLPQPPDWVLRSIVAGNFAGMDWKLSPGGSYGRKAIFQCYDCGKLSVHSPHTKGRCPHCQSWRGGHSKQPEQAFLWGLLESDRPTLRVPQYRKVWEPGDYLNPPGLWDYVLPIAGREQTDLVLSPNVLGSRLEIKEDIIQHGTLTCLCHNCGQATLVPRHRLYRGAHVCVECGNQLPWHKGAWPTLAKAQTLFDVWSTWAHHVGLRSGQKVTVQDIINGQLT
jgi:DNA-directed RNA polymerase subunit RPC12/RpoP